MADQPAEERGPRIFARLGAGGADAVAAEQQDAVALALRAALP